MHEFSLHVVVRRNGDALITRASRAHIRAVRRHYRLPVMVREACLAGVMISVLCTGDALADVSAGWLIVRSPALRTFAMCRVSCLPSMGGDSLCAPNNKKSPRRDGNLHPNRGLTRNLYRQLKAASVTSIFPLGRCRQGCFLRQHLCDSLGRHRHRKRHAV